MPQSLLYRLVLGKAQVGRAINLVLIVHAGGAQRVLESSSVSYIYYSKKYYVQHTTKTIVVPLVLSVIDTSMICRLINVCVKSGSSLGQSLDDSRSRGQGRKGRGWPRLEITPGVQETNWVQQQRVSVAPLCRFWSDRWSRDQK